MAFDPEVFKKEKLARRQALRLAVVAIQAIPQFNKGKNDLIRRRDVMSAISKMEPNGLEWGCIFDEEGTAPAGTPANLWRTEKR